MKAKRQLEARGWLVERAPKVLCWFQGKVRTKRHDYFGLWDLLCVKNGATLYVQVATVRKPPAWFKRARAFPAKRKEMWVARNRKPFRRILIVVK